jgi:hypothetical protein
MLHGQSSGKAITLMDGGLTNYTISTGGDSIIRIKPHLAFIGNYWLEDETEARFDKVNAGLGGLINWLAHDAIERTWHKNGNASLKYRPIRCPVAEIGDATVN